MYQNLPFILHLPFGYTSVYITQPDLQLMVGWGGWGVCTGHIITVQRFPTSYDTRKPRANHVHYMQYIQY